MNISAVHGILTKGSSNVSGYDQQTRVFGYPGNYERMPSN